MIMEKLRFLKEHVIHVNQEFFFLTTTWQDKQRHRCCHVCKDLDFTESSKDASIASSSS